jgi:hypothetical protein
VDYQLTDSLFSVSLFVIRNFRNVSLRGASPRSDSHRVNFGKPDSSGGSIMKRHFAEDRQRSEWREFLWVLAAIIPMAAVQLLAQTPVNDSVVPRLVSYSGVARDANGKTMRGVVGATFAVYADPEGGAALWIETQNIETSANGGYSVQLGATKLTGLTVDLFSAGQARWLGVSYNGGAEQPRIALLSVPYALKAEDAQTLGGLPVSAFVLAAPSSSSSTTSTATTNSAAAEGDALPAGSVTGSGTLDFIPLWTSASAIGNSVLFQSGSGSTARVGINTTTPGATLDVKGTTNLEGLLTLPAVGAATAAAGKASQAQDLVASAFNSGTSAAINQTFQWKAEASGNNTANPSGTLNLLFGSGAAAPAETGLKLSSKGLFTFAAGQTFPGTGTITGVTTAAGSGLTGGGTSGSLSLSLMKTCATNQTLQWNGSTWVCSSAGTGTITGVTTAAGSGLTGGGTSGSLSLSLMKTCAANQTLQWNGSTWVCSSAGTGTVTSVALSAPSSDFTVSGSPVTGAGTLKFAWSAAPTNADTANAIVKRDASGSFNATSITATGTLSATTANVNAIVGSTSLDGGSAIVGSATATGGNNRVYGVTGSSVSTVVGSTGVLGLDGNTNAAETNAFTMGVQGASSNQVSGIGVLGFDGTSLSETFDFLRGFDMGGAGVWGDGGTGTINPNFGVVGTMGDGIAGYFANNSPSDYDALVAFTYGGTGEPFLAGDFNSGASCTVDRFGNLNCTGSKNAVVPIDGGKRIVAMSAIEAPQNWFEDAGESELVNGAAAIQLDSNYTQTVNTDVKYQVFLTPYGDCKGLYVSNRTATSFEVHELGAGSATLSFGYRIMALRKNYESVRFADHTHDLDGHKRMMERMKARSAQAQPNNPVKIPSMASSVVHGPGVGSAH